MSQEKQPQPRKLEALRFLQEASQKDSPYRYDSARQAMIEELGFSPEGANKMVAEFLEAKISNVLVGRITQLPEPNPNRENNESQLTELERRAGWFALAYIEYSLGKNAHDLIWQGHFWLGNSDEETRQLLKWMEKNPQKVVDYFDWAWAVPETSKLITESFREKAKTGGLRKVEFEN